MSKFKKGETVYFKTTIRELGWGNRILVDPPGYMDLPNYSGMAIPKEQLLSKTEILEELQISELPKVGELYSSLRLGVYRTEVVSLTKDFICTKKEEVLTVYNIKMFNRLFEKAEL